MQIKSVNFWQLVLAATCEKLNLLLNGIYEVRPPSRPNLVDFMTARLIFVSAGNRNVYFISTRVSRFRLNSLSHAARSTEMAIHAPWSTCAQNRKPDDTVRKHRRCTVGINCLRQVLPGTSQLFCYRDCLDPTHMNVHAGQLDDHANIRLMPLKEVREL